MSTENDLVAKCPKCASMFRLTPQHLQAAKGWVQCGMCGNVFHSGLTPAGAEAQAPDPVPKTASSAEATSPASEQIPEHISPALEAGAAPAAATAAEAAAEAASDAAAAGLSGLANRMAESDIPSTFGPKLESIILVDPNLPAADDDYGPMPVIEPSPETPKPGQPAAAEYAAATPPRGGWGARQSTATSTGWIPRRPVTSTPVRPAKKSKIGWLWAVIVLVLLLALAAQLVFHLRDKLAAGYPELRPQLARMCDALGCTLSLPRDTRQVLILGSDLQTENEGNLKLEITLANRAAHAMAWPVLELTLTDVEDQPIARRMFAPSEYLPSGKMENAGIEGRSEIPFILQLQSKGLKAAGYRLRMFY